MSDAQDEQAAPPNRLRRLALAASVAFAAFLSVRLLVPGGESYAIETKPGETRTIALADGGAIVVNGGSHIVLDREDERVAAPKPARGQPPEPIKPVGGVKAGGQKAPSEMSFEEYKAWREGS